MNDTITIARRVASPQSAFDEARTEWPDRPTLTWWTIDRPVLVLGSAQPMSIVDLGAAARAGVEVVRRCSGGGAVLLAPNDVVWADLVISPTDTRWSDDIVVAAHWVGDAWRSALIDLGVQEHALFLHAGRSVRTRWSDLVCFAGLGPGELTLGGRKVLGIAPTAIAGRGAVSDGTASPMGADSDRRSFGARSFRATRSRKCTERHRQRNRLHRRGHTGRRRGLLGNW